MSSTPEQKPRILLVDDDPNICRFISESLRLRGFDVDCFASAELVHETSGGTRYDLALFDILLPGENGLQLCRKVRQVPGHEALPVIMMTAFYRQADQIREAKENYGATDYLLKPFPLQTLHAKIDQLLGSAKNTSADSRIDINGNLRETPLPRILHNLYSLRTTGLLYLQRGDLKKVVYIKNGYPIFVRSNLVREFLGQRLINAGILSKESLDQSLVLAKENGRRHGTALISMGILTPHQLHDALHQQVVDKLLDVFSWPQGEYRFVQAREFKQGVTSIVLSPANLILQGLREKADRTLVTELLAPHLDRYPQAAENPLYRFQEIQLSPNDQRILQQCNGKISLRELLDRRKLSRHNIEPLLAALLSTGILISREEPCPQTDASPCETSTQQREEREKFMHEYTRMMQQNFFDLLDLDKNADRTSIRKAYFALVKQYHPDRFFEQATLTDVKNEINTLFQKINEAHETLIDPVRKAQYLHELKEPKQENNHLELLIRAETAFHRGITLFRRKKFQAAQAEFDQAVACNPEEAEYLTYQAWTSVKLAPNEQNNTTQAKQILLKAVDLNPRLSTAHLYLGYLLKKEGKNKEALRRFERAIHYNPDCTEALRELRLHRMRQQREQETGKRSRLFRKPRS